MARKEQCLTSICNIGLLAFELLTSPWWERAWARLMVLKREWMTIGAEKYELRCPWQDQLRIELCYNNLHWNTKKKIIIKLKIMHISKCKTHTENFEISNLYHEYNRKKQTKKLWKQENISFLKMCNGTEKSKRRTFRSLHVYVLFSSEDQERLFLSLNLFPELQT